jgi:hypothetical protein
MGPEKFGGFGDVEAKARAQAEATGGKLEDIIDEVSVALDCVTLPLKRIGAVSCITHQAET